MDNPSYVTEETDRTIQRKGKQENGSIYDSNHVDKSFKNQSTKTEEPLDLKKRVGLFGAVAFVMGSVIGSGIFISPKGVLLYAGSPGLSLVIWTVCGLFSLIGCFVFAELGTLIPRSGGEFIFLLEGFAPDRQKEKPYWFQPLLAFLFNWQCTFLTKPGSLAVLSLTCAEHIVRLGVLQCPDYISYKSPEEAVNLIAACLILILWFVNTRSVKSAARLQIVFTTAKVVALLLIISGGISVYLTQETTKFSTSFEDSKYEFGSLAGAFYSGMWAYAGWDNICLITKEVHNPKRNIPISLFLSMICIIIIYLAVNVSYLTVLTSEEILASNAVAVSFGARVAGHVGIILIVASVACSTFGSANGGMFTVSRLSNEAAREGHMLEVISYVHVHHLTPATAITLSTIMGIFYVYSSSILTLIRLAGFIDGFFLFFCMAALLVMRQTKGHYERSFKSPIIFPILFMLFSMFLFITPLIGKPKIEYIYVLLFVLAGVVLYIPFVHFNMKLPGLGFVTRHIQILFQVGPPEQFVESTLEISKL